MVKNVVIKPPPARMVIGAKTPQGEQATIHFVPVPTEALAEVQEVLKKYQPQMEKFSQLLQQAQKEG